MTATLQPDAYAAPGRQNGPGCQNVVVRSGSVTADDGVKLHVAVCGSGPRWWSSAAPGACTISPSSSMAPVGFRCWFPDPAELLAQAGAHDMAGRSQTWRPSAVPTTSTSGSCSDTRGDPISPFATHSTTPRVRGVVGIAGPGCTVTANGPQPTRSRQGHRHACRDRLGARGPRSADELVQEARIRGNTVAGAGRQRTPMVFVAAGNDIRPSWPLQQLASWSPTRPSRSCPTCRTTSGPGPQPMAGHVHDHLPPLALGFGEIPALSTNALSSARQLEQRRTRQGLAPSRNSDSWTAPSTRPIGWHACAS